MVQDTDMLSFTVRSGSAVLSPAMLAQWQSDRAAIRAIQPNEIRFFSVCSGIEAASVAWKPIGWKCIGVAEIEKFPSAVLAHHYPDIPNHGDFTKIKTKRLGRVDVLCGGTPCQAFSVAGARRSLDDARGNLTLAFVGLAHELADGNGLRNAVWENVPGVLSTKDNAFGCFLAGLVGADEPLVPIEPKPADGKSNRQWGWSAKEKRHYIKWPRAGLVTGPKGRAAWTVKDAQYFGLAQRRERVILVADFGNGADPAAVLFEPEGVRRHSPPSREAGQGTSCAVAPSLVSSGRGVARTGDTRGQDPVVAVSTSGNGYWREGIGAMRGRAQDSHENLLAYAPQIARCVATREGQSQDFESTTMVAVSVAPTLRAGGNSTGGDRPYGTDVDTCDSLIVVGVTGPISHALKAEGADASEDGTGRGTPIICVHGTQDPYTSEHIGFAMGTNKGQENVVAYMPARTFGADGGIDERFAVREICDSLHTGSGSGNKAPLVQAVQSAVRRLTPRECERLQGFQFLVSSDYPGARQDHSGRWWSPDYTAIPWRGKPASECPDGPRYKALGNSWAVPKFRWLGERIARLMPR
jgi:DNA (cytosine-5)-methyltransferase 1